MDKKHKGAHSELIACSWLLSKGYEVFRNVSPHGPIDIIAHKDGTEYKIDVKSSHPSYVDSPRLSEEQINMGVIPLYVTTNGNCTCAIE